MTLTTPFRKLNLTAHVVCSMGWFGALLVFLAHALASVISQDVQMVRAASIAMGLTAWFVILPLSFAALTTGVVQALGTAWGLLRHYWILFKLLLTGVATGVLLLKMGPISYLAEVAAETSFSSADLEGLRTSLMIHAAGGLLVLLAAAALGVYKPQGMTPYGLRKQREPAAAGTASGAEAVVETPRWVKVFGLIAGMLILTLGAMVFGGDHGPGAHL